VNPISFPNSRGNGRGAQHEGDRRLQNNQSNRQERDQKLKNKALHVDLPQGRGRQTFPRGDRGEEKAPKKGGNQRRFPMSNRSRGEGSEGEPGGGVGLKGRGGEGGKQGGRGKERRKGSRPNAGA